MRKRESPYPAVGLIDLLGDTGGNMDNAKLLRQAGDRLRNGISGTPGDAWLLDAAALEIEKLRKVADAARCIRHWHDRANGGMVVSGEHVMALWQALHELDVSPNAAMKGGE